MAMYLELGSVTLVVAVVDFGVDMNNETEDLL